MSNSLTQSNIFKDSSWIEKYLVFEIPEHFTKSLLKKTDSAENGLLMSIINLMKTYQTMVREKTKDSSKVYELLKEKIDTYITKLYEQINAKSVDINYYLKTLKFLHDKKFSQILEELEISHLIKMFDYSNYDFKFGNTFNKLSDEYFKMFSEKILFGKYGNENLNLYEMISNKWQQIDFLTMVKFTNLLSKMKFYKIDVSKYEQVLSEKFNQEENIVKLLNFTIKRYLTYETAHILDVNDEEIISKYELEFIIGCMKSSGFSYFEKYYLDMLVRHKNLLTSSIGLISKDIKLINNFINILVRQESNNVNRYVNDILIRARNYLYDLEESFYNNTIFKKIKICAESEKYKTIDLTNYSRDKCNFQILKYNYNLEKENILASTDSLSLTTTDLGDEENFVIQTNELADSLRTYLDMYDAFYRVRYPDRIIEYDLNKSSTIVKMIFSGETYFIHMALIQYLILEKIYSSSSGITVQSIQESVGIPLNKLSETFNSLLKIKIVKRTPNDTNPSEIKFLLNKDFTFESKKISIVELIKQEKIIQEVKREFMHDRNMIVLANLVNYAKKNTFFTRDTIEEQLGYKIPFKLSAEYIDVAIERALKDEYIKKREIAIDSSSSDIIYEYYDE